MSTSQLLEFDVININVTLYIVNINNWTKLSVVQYPPSFPIQGIN